MPASDNSPSVSVPDATIHDPHQRRAILIAVCIALMAVIASVSGLNVASRRSPSPSTPPQNTVSG
ncbi:hypothetical protein [Salinispora arenicola]|uniref:hypothetical protein n=1 Tax=Salinispora arenicola TaxID=168697 RepID=UPI0027DC17DE|nr:hypothetical protein [Salinispora arenicola]